MRARLLVILSAVALVSAACGTATAQPPTPSGAISVELTEWRVVVPSSTQAGSLTFVVKNTGSIAHDLTILKTDFAADKIPQANGKASEDGKIAGTAELNPGQSTNLTATLQPGNYVFICNELGHYALGMHSAVRVG